MNYNLSIKKAHYFSFFKGNNSEIFNICKIIRCKYYKSIKCNSIIPFTCRKDLIITKDISFNYIKESSDNTKNSLNLSKDNNLDNDKNKKVCKIKSKKYCKKLVNKLMNNSNTLIEPILYEDTLYKNKKSINKVENSSNKININKFLNNKFINKRFSFNNITNSFNNNFKINNLFKKENYFTNINNNFNFSKSFTTKLPICFNMDIEKNKNLNLFNDKIRELNKLKYNNNFIIDNKNNLYYEDNFNLLGKNVKDRGKSLPNNETKKEKYISNVTNKQKGRRSKNSEKSNTEVQHTKYSSDNMMRKIKNKVIESSRLLANKMIKEEIKNNPNIQFKQINKEFRKIKGSFSQELNIKYNFWFYQIKIKDIFSMEISNKYTTIEKSSNKQLINFIFSPINEENFIKTKILLNIPFHQFYHDIFLNENKNWKNIFGINENDNTYQIDNMIKNIQNKEELNNENIKYINDINELAYNYEKYFLEKKPRNVDYNNKKNEFIKNFMNNLLNDKYFELCEEVKKLKSFYENRKLLINQNYFFPLNNIKNEIRLDISLIKNNNYIIQNKNSDIKNLIENNNKIIKYDNLLLNNNQITRNEKIQNNNMNLDENKNEYYNENICNNIKEEQLKKEKEKEIFDEKKLNFCNRKRNRKIKYFISCKKYKKTKNNNGNC